MAEPTRSGSIGSASTARKRKSSTNEDGTERPIKHRSSKACQACRTRKVRCDVVVTNGSRCTNCRLDGMECVVVASRRGKNNHSHRNSIAKSTGSVAPQPKTTTTDSKQAVTRKGSVADYEAVPSSPIANGADPVPACVSFDHEVDNSESEPQSASNDVANNGAYRPPFQPYDGLLTPETATNTFDQQQSRPTKVPLPAFIIPLSSRILGEDLAFLAQKGALTLPEPDLQVEILRAYLFSVHPFSPMLNFRPFVHAVLNNREDSQISLLLFQSVMFAGVHSLPSHIIHRLGFESPKHAREVFFKRARILYEFDVEPDNIAVLQSLVLLSSWYSKWNDRRHTWHWTGVAYDVARSLGLHREPSTRYASEEVRRFRRRLWWSLYIRDRMIALGTRRPMRIHDENFDVAMLTLDDFDLEPVDALHQGQPIMPSIEENTSTALMCIELAKLGRCIGHITSSQYTTLSTQPDVPHTIMVVARRDEGHVREVERCDGEINEWLRTLGSNVRRANSPTSQIDPHSCTEVHWEMLNLYYQTAVNVLHRAQALKPTPSTTEAQVAQRMSRSKVKDSARHITKLSQNMLHQDQARFLSLIGVTALIAACLSHMLDISSGDEDIRDASKFRLYQSLQVLQLLRQIYASADAAVSFVASVTRRAGISVPAEYADSPSTFPIPNLARPSAGTNPSDAWRHSVDLSDGQSKAGLMTSPSHMLGEASNNHPQSQMMLDRNNQTINTSGTKTPGNMEPLSPSIVAFASSSNANGTPSNGLSQALDTTLGMLPSSAADGGMFDWNNGMDLESMAFNYDFYSGFLEGRFQGW